LHYFLGVFPVSFLPWVLFLPGGIWLALRLVRHRERTDPHEGEAARLALTWFLFTFVFFSIISGKKTRYLLPLFPAASWLAAAGLREVIHGAGRWGARLRGSIPTVLGAAAGAVAGLAGVAVGTGALGDVTRRIAGLSPDQTEALGWYARLPGGLLLMAPGAAIFMLSAAALWYLARRPAGAAACLLAAVIVLIGTAQWVGLPAADHVKSAAPLAALVNRAAGPDGEVILYRDSHEGLFNVALRRDQLEVMSRAPVTAQYLGARPGACVIAVQADMVRLERELASLERLGCRRVGDETICAACSPGP
jgi:hypothetical protein